MKMRANFVHTQPSEYHLPAYVKLAHSLEGASIGSHLHITTEKGREATFTVVAVNTVIESYVIDEQWESRDGGANVNTFKDSGIPEKIIKPVHHFDSSLLQHIQIKLSRNGKFYELGFYNDHFYIWSASSVSRKHERNRVASIKNESNKKTIERMLSRIGLVLH